MSAQGLTEATVRAFVRSMNADAPGVSCERLLWLALRAGERGHELRVYRASPQSAIGALVHGRALARGQQACLLIALPDAGAPSVEGCGAYDFEADESRTAAPEEFRPRELELLALADDWEAAGPDPQPNASPDAWRAALRSHARHVASDLRGDLTAADAEALLLDVQAAGHRARLTCASGALFVLTLTHARPLSDEALLCLEVLPPGPGAGAATMMLGARDARSGAAICAFGVGLFRAPGALLLNLLPGPYQGAGEVSVRALRRCAEELAELVARHVRCWVLLEE
jgi:hypothetical protein